MFISTIILTFVFIPCLVALLFYNKKPEPQKILSTYRQPGKWYWFKYILMVIILTLKKFKTKLEEVFLNTEKIKLAIINNLETPQALSSHEQAFDAVFFHGANMENYYLCGGIESRHEGKSFGLFYIMIPSIGLLGNEKLPLTVLETCEGKAFTAEGISCTPIKPMQEWKLCFKGKMKSEENPKQTYDVHLKASWTAMDFPYYSYERDMNIKVLAGAIAKEKWTHEYFQTFKEAHQKHYEQMGFIKGTIDINNKMHEINMMGFRDHSFGYKRDWSLLHRYVFHILHMSDNTRIAVGIISNPSTMSHLEVGYIVHQDKTFDSIESCDFKLYQHGENGVPPNHLAFSFFAGSVNYIVKVSVQHQAVHYKGYSKEAKLIERFVTCNVNGIKGIGISEWHYNNLKS